MLIDERNLWALAHYPFISLKQKWQLLKLDPTLHFLNTKIQSTSTSLQKTIEQFIQFSNTFPYDELKERYFIQKIEVVSLQNSLYPLSLLQVYLPPLLLFTKGNTSLLNKEKIAVIGSRKGNEEGKRIIEQLFPSLIDRGMVIVSGGAKGIDFYAHDSTLKLGGNTIAVLAGGLFHMYPRNHLSLFREIALDSLVVTEHPPSTFVQKWHFVERNRIISGISKGVIVIQAEINSGSMSTVRHALDQGKEVFVTPGCWGHALSKGPQLLAKEGATLVTCSDDIFREIENKPFTNIASFV
ncbi:DNA-processing protein DprA [Mangrovibacillus cuniculi]|uniref:DNA-protecting protein DprA n=1 Tax=Mangrovibacillus cuniculi TaxID=2593652 RepID=A0A7S8CAG4_9BACI|nr:DNA-processing protein DprA [Mangrovibacillus cuniculi]QPC46332.1 DNA-protecting protein DprA [Mangrovibacillus cuniculi]